VVNRITECNGKHLKGFSGDAAAVWLCFGQESRLQSIDCLFDSQLMCRVAALDAIRWCARVVLELFPLHGVGVGTL
jgi:hypothetical protein